VPNTTGGWRGRTNGRGPNFAHSNAGSDIVRF
jgi:hypothetical protein